MNQQHLIPWLRRALPVLVGAALLLIADTMLNRPDTSSATSDLLPQLPPARSQGTVRAENNITKLFAAFDQTPAAIEEPVERATNEVIPDLAAQAQQQGLLRELYIDNFRYRLSGIINQQGFYANLTVTDLTQSDAPSTRETLKTGDQLGPYLVVSVTARQLRLQQNNRQLWLQLFVPASEAKAQP